MGPSLLSQRIRPIVQIGSALASTLGQLVRMLPPISNVGTSEFCTWVYSLSSGFVGQASRRRPPAQISRCPQH
jgi:hypothetical protein